MASTAQFRVIGLERLRKHIDKMSNPELVFDSDFAKASRIATRQLGENTPRRKVGSTRTGEGWQLPQKLGLSKYSVSNNKTTQDKKHSIAAILNFGRGVVYPVKAKRLYIPLTNKGMSKKLGASIPKGLVYGTDYVLAKKAKAYPGTKFIDKTNTEISRGLIRSMIQTIRSMN
jgi:hypothetical protein